MRAAMAGGKPTFTDITATARRIAKGASGLFDAGVDFIILDTYVPERRLLQRAARSVPLEDPSISVMDFYNECIPQGVSPYHNHRRKLARAIIVMDDIGERDGDHSSRTIANHAGHNPQKGPVRQPLAKRCTLPFRELSVTWNGDVCVCCHDWAHEAVVGNVLEQPLEEIWYGDKWVAFRRMLNAKNREFGPCKRCDYKGGGRQGLLPDVGEYMPSDRKVIRQVLEDSK
jgi:radical SAM protein with 4Fe4S-binding SPASM domain